MKKLKIITCFLLPVWLSACNNTESRIENADTVSEMATEDTAVVFQNDAVWDRIDFEIPVIVVPELQNTDITVRGSDSVSIYEVAQDIMFDTDKAEIRPEGKEKLEKIAQNIKQRTQGNGMIRVYGFTDSRGSKEYNQELGRERAKAVEDWLTTQAGFDNSRLKVVSMGQQAPEATNETAAGRQQNRRVEIVVVNG